jgi:hypothetical protein
MKRRSLLPTLFAFGSLVVLAGCDDETEIAGPFDRFTQFSILIEVTNLGTGSDGNGFLVEIQPSGKSERVAAGELLRVESPKGSTYTVTLSDVASNCTVLDGSSRSIRVKSNDQGTLARRADFAVSCS